MTERLQKILSARGVASRRKAEEMIAGGLVSVNGITAVLVLSGETKQEDVDAALPEERPDMIFGNLGDVDALMFG